MPRAAPRDPTPLAQSLYETDFFAWTRQQASLLRSGNLQGVDLPNLIEEIETLGRSERAAVRSAYRLIALHLLKLVVQQERASRSWYGTIARERGNAESLLAENPSLKPQRAALFAEAYRMARKEAAAETGLPLAVVPEEPPFTIEELLDDAYLPRG